MFATFPIATKMLKIFVLFAVMLNSLFHKINFHSFSFFRFSCRSIILLLLLLQKKKKKHILLLQQQQQQCENRKSF